MAIRWWRALARSPLRLRCWRSPPSARDVEGNHVASSQHAPPELENVGIEQHLDAQVPPDLPFRDEAGKTVKLGDYFGRKPIILDLVYYNCTMLCGEVLAGLDQRDEMVNFNMGEEFDVITVSFDPSDTPELAAAKKKDYVQRYGRPGAQQAGIS